MQIHELTQRQRTDEGLADIASKVGQKVAAAKGLGSKIAAPFKAAGQAYAKTQIDQKVAATADKAYTAWKNYRTQLDSYYAKSGKPAPAGTYEKALLSFVQKNLLGGAYLPNLINKDEIVGLVKQIAGDQTVTPAAPAAKPAPATTASTAVAGAPKPGAPTPAEQAKLQQKIQQALAKKPVQEALNPAQEKQLFSQLVRAAALASTEVATGQDKSARTDTAAPDSAQALVGQVRDTEQQQAQITPEQLARAGKVLMQTFQIDSTVESTGDKAVDALLLAMGFRPS